MTLTYHDEPLLMLPVKKFTVHPNGTTQKVAERCFDDLIKAYYEGLTVLIKDFLDRSFPAALLAIFSCWDGNMSCKMF
jgi:hypothetical protein